MNDITFDEANSPLLNIDYDETGGVIVPVNKDDTITVRINSVLYLHPMCPMEAIHNEYIEQKNIEAIKIDKSSQIATINMVKNTDIISADTMNINSIKFSVLENDDDVILCTIECNV